MVASLHFHIALEVLFLCLGLKQGKAVYRNKSLYARTNLCFVQNRTQSPQFANYFVVYLQANCECRFSKVEGFIKFAF